MRSRFHPPPPIERSKRERQSHHLLPNHLPVVQFVPLLLNPSGVFPSFTHLPAGLFVNTSSIAGSGGGLAALYGTRASVTGTTFHACSAQAGGGLASLFGSQVDAVDAAFRHVSASAGGGVAAWNFSYFSAVNSRFTDCRRARRSLIPCQDPQGRTLAISSPKLLHFCTRSAFANPMNHEALVQDFASLSK